MDWRGFAKSLLLDGGRITEREAALLRRAILADRVVDREEAEFLIDLKRSASAVHPDFDRFLYEVLKRAVLRDGTVSDDEARWLRTFIQADRQVTPVERQFLEELRAQARSTGPEFERLCRECLGAGATPPGAK